MIETYGGHRAQCGDALADLSPLMAGATAAVFYSDPPWGPGLMTFFQRLAQKDASVAPVTYDYRTFLNELLRVAVRHTEGPIFIEYGPAWKNDVINAGRAAGCEYIDTFDALYSTPKRPLHVHLFAPPSVSANAIAGRAGDPAYRAALQKASGFPAVVLAIQPFARQGGIVLDPCCGFGIVARAAIRLGMRFYGNELNPKRLERARAVLRREAD